MDGLTPAHMKESLNYLKFARLRRDQSLEELKSVIEETKDSRLMDETYTREEVEELLESLSSALDGTISEDLLAMSHTNLLLLQQLFSQGQKANLEAMTLNTAIIDDSKLQEKVKQMEEDSKKDRFLEETFAKAPGGSPVGKKLPTLGAHIANEKLETLNELEKLKEENKNLKESMLKMQQQSVSILKQKSDVESKAAALDSDVEGLKGKLTAAESADAEKAKEAKAAQKQMEAKVQALEDEVSALRNIAKEREEEEKKTEDASAAKKRSQAEKMVQQLKKMLEKKNTQIREYIKTLQTNGIIELGPEAEEEN
uniref:Leucine zipper transcription factor-like protein 1 n=1 Tax=Palpitomonas bilix TaxID=652834 RepID=A0A7S3G1Q7_9EUKA|mmetsp:Transcript_21632/g.56169  ORF Transcript_21632/g.56169 Transcript_21632/m.56169 type:complete len:313 (+) Transcript_21632:99-1037(+)|eukprot:CAMPEP_0113885848 /NCGR_PEP_ID=MMETSP0780_2-20120614/11171_1 /TAXON_ID=652834 /ORGANISM="Palpitomonas bilix" /LENGTH=312 /DNA_ID=CAMNT_0000873885 /DNA_START=73 /DNA_END=1011 /DNA_ORIENTATION=+ /assembly_acc=CAM_ASM_000599